MGARDHLQLEWETLRQIYDFIARQDGVEPSSLAEAGGDVDEEDVEQLLEAGYVEVYEGEAHLAVPAPASERADERIRVARRGDLPEIEAVIEEVTDQQTYVEAETVAEELDRDERLIRFDGEKTRVFFVAEVGGEIVGWLHIESPEREKLKHTARFTVGVGETHRGRGIGKRLMTSGLRWAEAHGYRKVYNEFPATNRGALAFLDELDYDAHCEAVRRDHYLIDDRFVDQMTLAVYLSGGPETQTHFDRVQRESQELY